MENDNEKSQRSSAWKFFKIAGIIWLVLLVLFVIIIVIVANGEKNDPGGEEGMAAAIVMIMALTILIPSLAVIGIVTILLKLPRLSGSSNKNTDIKND